MSDWLPTGDTVGRYPTWRTVQGTQVLYGRYRLFVQAISDNGPVELKDGTLVDIKYVTPPNGDDYAYAWPTGTRTNPRETVEIRQANHRSSQRPRIRRHGTFTRNKRRRDRTK